MAQFAFGLCCFTVFAAVAWPKMLYVEEKKKRPANNSSVAPTVYGLAFAVSAPLVVLLTAVLLLTMMVLGDGLAPSAVLTAAAMALFFFVDSVYRYIYD